MGEARNIRDPGLERLQAAGTVTPYQVVQMPSGKAGFYDNKTPAASGDYVEYETAGTFNCTKATGFIALKGGRAYWDVSAGNVNYKKVADRDFYLGRFAEDATNAATSCAILANEDPPYDLDIARDPASTIIVGTQALGGLGLYRRGGTHKIVLNATNEAQKVDLLSKDGFARTANAIIELAFNVISDGAGTTVDANIGLANATHASDADSIAEHLLVHLDANNTSINLQSKDGSNTVAATDTTLDYTEGDGYANRVEVWIDMRDEADIQVYVNGALALGASVFRLDNATGPLRLLFHVEKTATTDTYEIDLDWLRARFADQ
jgi:hypothetical protein